MSDALAEIDGLRIAFEGHDGTLMQAVRGISLWCDAASGWASSANRDRESR